MIEWSDLDTTDETIGRRLLAVARAIAPCLNTLTDEARTDAIAILDGVAGELPSAGSGRVRSRSRNGTSISYADLKSAFSDDDRDALRALCAAAGGSPTIPVGSFPDGGVIGRLWPEAHS